MDAVILVVGGLALIVVLGASFHETVIDLFVMFTVEGQRQWEDDICNRRGHARRRKQIILHTMITSALALGAAYFMAICISDFVGSVHANNYAPEQYTTLGIDSLFAGTFTLFVVIGLACRLIVLRAKIKAVDILAAEKRAA